ncbi:Cytochrome c-type biogenesis protein CcmH [Sinobacterium norvegicum]|uniref:Cytochrome c-type biogenesis protein n=1 Tax=Sinobacterium norvegicum TaxID=1641715 RepID=A0ABM9AB12_9GAMM|nr:cytochrome c-type biogenesis protein [Sinobacterium norvegicum]CAH0990382.1 Cytochrome c-type biogenesis protein CcmH [Sinobacterium norvegicum]
MRIALLFIGFFSVLISPMSFAVIETYEFTSTVDEKRYQHFLDELRCPKCQNQNLKDSDSPIAADLREQLHLLIDDGKSDTEITAFMVARYGEFILYRPQLNAETMILWFGPGVLLLFAGIVLIVVVRRSQKAALSNATQANEASTDPAPAAISSEQQKKLDQLLIDGKDQS